MADMALRRAPAIMIDRMSATCTKDREDDSESREFLPVIANRALESHAARSKPGVLCSSPLRLGVAFESGGVGRMQQAGLGVRPATAIDPELRALHVKCFLLATNTRLWRTQVWQRVYHGLRAQDFSSFYAGLAYEAIGAWSEWPELRDYYHKTGWVMLDREESDLADGIRKVFHDRGHDPTEDVALEKLDEYWNGIFSKGTDMQGFSIGRAA
ncbi:hypothetical protein CERZMDRAFT_103113 [Cercospora zeae-maydis SCOH1-5]|uniref:Uncharacterized protein n=1 Tax=Cercospora zeae-maydis SCOH1-5 TaxID=717836 RepID=A0A6A6F0L0_9PEZI|nr:hypothetical protein CERZMDRAFT_103113 [Cercospora zeae-maydis SCOH1-5]